MLYSELLNHPTFKKAFHDADVTHIPSVIKEDFIIDLSVQDAQPIIDNEILHRRKFAEHQKKMSELEEKMKPYKKLEAKKEFIKPFIQKIIGGKLQNAYSTLENATIEHLAEQAARRYEFDEHGEVTQKEDYSGLSELQKVLKQASIVKLNQKMSVDEIATRTVLDSCISNWLK